MNIAKLNEALNSLKEDLGAGLLAADIFAVSDSQSIAGINSNPKFCALFNQITEMINKALKAGGSPSLRKHYILDLNDNKIIIVALLNDYTLGILIDSQKTQLGLLLNVVLPNVTQMLSEAFGA